jgi:hypothetical protein
MKNLCKITLCFSLFLLLVGCGCIHDRFCEYRGSCNRPPLMVPPCMHPGRLGDDLIIPNACECTEVVPLLPPESMALEIVQGKISKKTLKVRERDSRITRITWIKNRCGASALMTNKALYGTWNHLERALKQLAPLYRIRHADEALATFYIYDLAATRGRLCAATPLYQIRLVEFENGTMISVVSNEEEVILPEDIIHRILGDLYQALESTKEGLSLKQWLFN